MRNHNLCALSVLLILLKCFNAIAEETSDTETQPGFTYSVLTAKAVQGDKQIHIISCNNGTLNCAYDWDNLCLKGKAFDTTPFGTIEKTPSYSNGRRMFICQ